MTNESTVQKRGRGRPLKMEGKAHEKRMKQGKTEGATYYKRIKQGIVGEIKNLVDDIAKVSHGRTRDKISDNSKLNLPARNYIDGYVSKKPREDKLKDILAVLTDVKKEDRRTDARTDI